jgi:hypothetical protein
VACLEKGDSSAAAAYVLEMERIMADLPLSMPQEEVAQARRLLERYAELGIALQQRVHDEMKRLGAAQHVRAYDQPVRRP